MDNKTVAAVLYEITRILELRDENIFRVRAFENAARAVEGIGEEVHDLIAEGKLLDVPGIGKSIAEIITELDRTGKSKQHEELKAAFPSTLFELFRIPNLGPKKIRKLYDDLGIASLQELEYACIENKLMGLKGFGKKTQDKILDGIKLIAASDGRHLLGKALPLARQILDYLRMCRDIERVEIAGSARRRKEIINDLDFVASTKHPAKVSDYFVKLPLTNSVIAKGDTKTSIHLEIMGLNVDLRVVKPEEFATALHHFTGSKEHNVELRGRAKKLGYKINEYGIFKEGKTRPEKITSEEDLYAFFGMDYVPPEMRENTGEVELAHKHLIPRLVEQAQLKGIFHVHSVWSDGHNTLDEMIRAARDRGYEFVGISEHSKAAAYAHGLDETRLAVQSLEIQRLAKKYPDIRILHGIEVDILEDGSLDFSDDVLKGLDFVIASVHSQFRMEEKQMTQRICRALSNPHVDILGHATGRILLGRPGYAVNIDEVLKTAKRHRKCIEINGSPHRMDLEWAQVKKACEMGIPLSINPDAHRLSDFDYVEYGVGAARRGWATADHILNTKSWDMIAKEFQARK